LKFEERGWLEVDRGTIEIGWNDFWIPLNIDFRTGDTSEFIDGYHLKMYSQEIKCQIV
jgi:hypothetical protein